MAISRQKKEELVETYKEYIDKSPVLVFTNFRGLTVSQLQLLRSKLYETDTTYMIVKNSLLGLALEQSGRTRPDDLLEGPNGIAFVGEDISKSVTALLDWNRAEKVLEIRGAMLESTVLDETETESLKDLPTKEEILAKLVGTINSPATSLVRTVDAPPNSLARVLHASTTGLLNVINAYVEKQKAEAG